MTNSVNTSKVGGRKSSHRVNAKITALSAEMPEQTCGQWGCKRQVSAATGKGLSVSLCRYHQQLRNRHGSPWCRSFKATELAPYVNAARAFIKANLHDNRARAALSGLSWMLAFSGRVEPAMDLRGFPAKRRAKIAIARLAEAGVSAQRLLSAYLGVSALFEDDWECDRAEEYRIVQIAKAVHRLASGTHRRWEYQPPGADRPVVTELHAYPRSAGLVLREIGAAIEKEACGVREWAVPLIIAKKTDMHGVHQSHILPSQRRKTK